MLLSVLQNAADEARAGSVINIYVWVKALTEYDISKNYSAALNIDILDFCAILVC